jgi:hypothetical protein
VSDLREVLQTAAPTPSAPFEAPALESAVVRRQGVRRRLTVTAVVLLVAVVAAGLGLRDRDRVSEGAVASRDLGGEAMSTSTTTLPSTTTTTAAAPTAGAAVVSPEIEVGRTPTVVAGWSSHLPGNGATGRIDVLQLRGTWQVVASIEIAQPGIYDYPNASQALAVREVTGDGRPDVIFPMMAASVAPFVVVSDDGGVWRLLGFGAPDQTIILSPDEPDGDTLVTSSRLCTPSCAAGRVLRQRWRYDHERQVFVELASAECDGYGAGGWRCVPADSPLRNGTPLEVSR